jgi:hypothetical protein
MTTLLPGIDAVLARLARAWILCSSAPTLSVIESYGYLLAMGSRQDREAGMFENSRRATLGCANRGDVS